ncbi:MAG: hypothetical protein M3Z25_11055 [Actinomycetota bacterium]|nr:hypothetical protein [Actinomycetota bacterium]
MTAHVADRPVPGQGRALARVVTVVRVLLALVLVTYGGVKLLGGQYYYNHDWVLDGSSVSEVRYFALTYTIVAALLVASDRCGLRLMLARRADVVEAAEAVAGRARRNLS